MKHRQGPATHLAIVKPPFLDEILAGRKTVESRLSVNRVAPYNRVKPGDRVLFKQSAGPYRAAATATQVRSLRIRSHDHLMAIFEAQKHHISGAQIAAARDFFVSKHAARYATLITIAEVTPINEGPAIPPLHGRAWLCLDQTTTATPNTPKPRLAKSA